MSDDYHDDYDHVSKTMLSHFAESPELYGRYYVERSCKPPLPSGVAIGSIVHDVVLDGKDLPSVARLYPESCLNVRGGLIGKNAADFRDEIGPNCYAVKEDEFRLCQAIIEAIRKQPIFKHDMVTEKPIRWQQDLLSGGFLKCRCKPDMLIEGSESMLIMDLKITEQPRPMDFAKVARRFKYWMQDAHYSAGVFAEHGKPAEFQFMVVECSFTPRIGIYQYNEVSRAAAVTEWEHLLDDLVRRHEQNDWQDPWTTETTMLDLKPFECPYSEREENKLDVMNWE